MYAIRSYYVNKSIHELQDWISNNISGNLDLTQLSDIACMSERNLTRTFKKATGVTIGKYISQLRLEMAKTLLFVITSYSIHYTKLYDAMSSICTSILQIVSTIKHLNESILPVIWI